MMTIASALNIAEEVKVALAQYCHQIEVAGSVRRRKLVDIKDIEIVAVPRAASLMDLQRLVNSCWGEPSIGRFPSKYTRIRGAYNLDLFWCTAETFPLNLFIRTGPADYSHRGLVRWKQVSGGGWSKDARLHRADGTLVDLKTEEDVFQALRWPWSPPEERK